MPAMQRCQLHGAEAHGYKTDGKPWRIGISCASRRLYAAGGAPIRSSQLELKRINQHVTVSPQISPADVPTLKAAGFTTIINNRPDGEAPDQPSSDTIQKAAQAAGMVYHYIPLGRDGVSPDMVERTTEALEASEGPVFCYCRSGTRSTTLWALSQAGKLPADRIIAEAAAAGYDMSHLAGHLGEK
jgi:uncharacterized protein (TIGR01244 family)